MRDGLPTDPLPALFAQDLRACVAERSAHPPCSKGAVLDYYALSWGREIHPGFLAVFVQMLEDQNAEAAR